MTFDIYYIVEHKKKPPSSSRAEAQGSQESKKYTDTDLLDHLELDDVFELENETVFQRLIEKR